MLVVPRRPSPAPASLKPQPGGNSEALQPETLNRPTEGTGEGHVSEPLRGEGGKRGARPFTRVPCFSMCQERLDCVRAGVCVCVSQSIDPFGRVRRCFDFSDALKSWAFIDAIDFFKQSLRAGGCEVKFPTCGKTSR